MHRAATTFSALAISAILVAVSGTQASAYTVGGKIADEYREASAANSLSPTQYFGNPTNSELVAKNNGRWQPFSKGNQAIYWNANVSNGHANQIGGDIRTEWSRLNNENGILGYPTSRELAARKAGGRYNRFQGGIVYWSPNTAANTVQGQILGVYGAAGWETSSYGFPTSQEFPCASRQVKGDDEDPYGATGQKFENGWIVANTESFTNKDNSIVDENKEVKYQIEGNAEYLSQIQAGISRWADLGQVKFSTANVPVDPITGYVPLYIYTQNIPDIDTAGMYQREDRAPTYFTADLVLNTAVANTAGKAQNVATHELGHALGLEHSCRGQLMDPLYNDYRFLLYFMDLKAYHDMWG